jgi:hypothetical protein
LGKFEFLGISNSPDGAEMQTFSSGQQEISWTNNSFYIFHPISKQQVICFGQNQEGIHGENQKEEDTIYKHMVTPSNIKLKEFKPVKIWSKLDYSIVQNDDGKMFDTGRMPCVISEAKFKDFGISAEKVDRIFIA